MRERIALGIVAAVQVADLITFIAAVAVLPITMEANPVVRELFHATGILGVAAYKLAGLVALLAAAAFFIRRTGRWKPVLLIGGLGGVIPVLGNVLSVAFFA